MLKSVPLLVAFGAALLCFSLFLGGGTRASAAAGPCNPATAAVDGEEQQFLGLVQTWRGSAVAGAVPLSLSAPLNAAAAWYAEYQLSVNGAGGHNDPYGRTWAQRSYDCGYTGTTSGGTPYANGAGEGVYGASGNISGSQALTGMITQQGSQSGIYIPGSPSVPAKCAGVAVARSATHTVWVIVIASYSAGGACPQVATTTPPTPGSATPTVPGGTTPTATSTTPGGSPTATASPSATATPTATPTPQVWRIALPLFACDSCLVSPAAPSPTAPVSASTPTPTTTAPVQPTATATSTPTVQATVGATCGGATAAITALNKQGEWVDITGAGNLTGWRLVSTLGAQEFAFPSGFLLNGTVRVKSGTGQGSIVAGELWWTTDPVWNNSQNDDAELYDCANQRVSTFDDGQ